MLSTSDVVVNKKVPRLFFVECIGQMRPDVRYLVRKEKERFGEGFQVIIGI